MPAALASDHVASNLLSYLFHMLITRALIKIQLRRNGTMKPNLKEEHFTDACAAAGANFRTESQSARASERERERDRPWHARMQKCALRSRILVLSSVKQRLTHATSLCPASSEGARRWTHVSKRRECCARCIFTYTHTHTYIHTYIHTLKYVYVCIISGCRI